MKFFKVSTKARVIGQKVASLNQISLVNDARRGHSESGVCSVAKHAMLREKRETAPEESEAW